MGLSKVQPLKYETKLVAFLDVLGFKDLVCSSRKADQSKVALYFDLIDKKINDLKNRRGKQAITSLVVSDSVILTIPFSGAMGNQLAAPFSGDRGNQLTNLRELCIAIREIQFELAKSDIWLRGAVTYGDVYISSDENQIVGSGFIEAYLLEEKVAINPRVIIDNKLINKLKTGSADTFIKILNGGQKSPGVSFSTQGVLFDWSGGPGYESSLTKDVALFIDYLDLAMNDEAVLESIIKNISEAIYSKPDTYKKFRWLTDYFIDVVGRTINSGMCEIDSKELHKCHKKLKQL